MADKIKVIVKRPDEKYGHVTHISNTLENLQKTVDGYIETLTMPGYVLILNEEDGSTIRRSIATSRGSICSAQSSWLAPRATSSQTWASASMNGRR